MSDLINKFVKDIKAKLNIHGGSFIDGEIADYVMMLEPQQYKEFFKSLSGDNFDYKKGMDRIPIAIERFVSIEKIDYTAEAKAIASKMHEINRTVSKVSYDNKNDCRATIAHLNIRATFHLSDKQAEIMEELGGREFILIVNQTEPNDLETKIIRRLESYGTHKKDLALSGSKIGKLANMKRIGH